MRLSETKLAQLVESNPPQVVILDESSDEEIALNPQEFWAAVTAMETFKPFMVVVV
jgi:hypothetical protein